MAKDSFYFQHDYNARNDEKILELRSNFGIEGYGIFWMLLESMAETEDGKLNLSLIGGLSLGYGMAKDRLKEIVDFCINVGLFEQDMQFFYSSRMLEHKRIRQEFSKQGKLGAEKRWGGYKGGDSQPNSKGKERKGKEIKNHFDSVKEIYFKPYSEHTDLFRSEHTQKEYENFQNFLKAMFRDFTTEQLTTNFDKCLGIGDWKKILHGKGFMVIKPALEKAIAAKEGNREQMALRIKTFTNGLFDEKVLMK